LRIQAGERLLLEGPSGGGKSTLGAVFTGLRDPSSGLLLLHGLMDENVHVAHTARMIGKDEKPAATNASPSTYALLVPQSP